MTAIPLPRPSILSIADGVLRGRVADCPPGREVHLHVDGRHVATELTLPLPQRGQCSFSFALPPGATDGFEHDLHVAIPGTRIGAVHGQTMPFRSAATRGEVRQEGPRFAGTVWRDAGGDSVLLVRDAAGTAVLELPLRFGARAERHGRPATFAVPCIDLPPGPLVFSCDGTALVGSPIARRQALLGRLEQVDDRGVEGWAFDSADVRSPIELVLRVDGRAVEWFRPNLMRADIAAHLGEPAEGFGLVGFRIGLPHWVRDGLSHRIEIASAASGEVLGEGQHIVCSPPPRPRLPVPQASARAAGPGVAPTTAPRVSVVILNRNGAALLDALLESWQLHNRTVACELIVVDHASSDDSLAMLQQWQARLPLRVVALDRNDSFSASCNRGARLASAQHLLFLNNDMVWLQDALPSMLQTLQAADVGVVGMKLVKVVAEGGAGEVPPVQAVQHLGVRFRLDADAYWPCEVSDDPRSSHVAVDVPAVTGAALLCRRADFMQVGGFDEAFFYGFEDVELCLRLAQSLRKRVVCRNDLVALHRHGHTRLSGRALSIFERVRRNADVLQERVGTWVKQAYWRSLLQADGYFTTEALRCGIVAADDRAALHIAERVGTEFPDACLVRLAPQADWKRVDDLHVLFVADARYDVRTLVQPRADLLVVACPDARQRWRSLPWWDAFDAVLGPTDPVAQVLARTHWRLRVEILWRGDREHEAAASLQRDLRAQGLPCWLSAGNAARMADVRLLVSSSTADLPAACGTLGVVWHPWRRLRTAHAGWIVADQRPTRAWLRQRMEQRVGTAFPAP